MQYLRSRAAFGDRSARQSIVDRLKATGLRFANDNPDGKPGFAIADLARAETWNMIEPILSEILSRITNWPDETRATTDTSSP